MKRRLFITGIIIVLCLTVCGIGAYGESNGSAALTTDEVETFKIWIGIQAISAGLFHSVALMEDGTMKAWGDNRYKQCDVPVRLTNVTAISAGGYHTVALREDGTVVAWGDNSYGQCDVPANLRFVVAVSAGLYHTVALRIGGSVVVWGDDGFRKNDVPSGLNNAMAISAGSYNTLALKKNGTVAAWWDGVDQSLVPANLSNVVAVAAGLGHAAALKENGTVVAWGCNERGQCNVPSDLRKVKAIAVGGMCTFALKENGTLVAWGDNEDGQLGYGNTSTAKKYSMKVLTGVKAVAAGSAHVLALKEDGTLWGWGSNKYGQLGNTVAAIDTETTVATSGFPPTEVVYAAVYNPNKNKIPSTSPVLSEAPSQEASDIPSLTLKLMTYNICLGAEKNRDEIQKIIKEVSPDILALEEVCGWGWDKSSYIASFAKKLGMAYYMAPTWRGINVAVFSKYTIIETENISEYIGNSGALRCVVEGPDGRRINVVVIHPGPYEVNQAVFEKIRGLMEPYSNQLCILMGDFNQRPSSSSLDPLRSSGWELVESGGIDNIYVLSQRAWDKTTVEIANAYGLSDHEPVGTSLSVYNHANLVWLQSISIAKLDAQAQVLTLQNNGSVDIDLSGWELTESQGNQTFVFPSGFVLAKGAALEILSKETDAAEDGTSSFLWDADNIWADGNTFSLFDILGRNVAQGAF